MKEQSSYDWGDPNPANQYYGFDKRTLIAGVAGPVLGSCAFWVSAVGITFLKAGRVDATDAVFCVLASSLCSGLVWAYGMKNSDKTRKYDFLEGFTAGFVITPFLAQGEWALFRSIISSGIFNSGLNLVSSIETPSTAKSIFSLSVLPSEWVLNKINKTRAVRDKLMEHYCGVKKRLGSRLSLVLNRPETLKQNRPEEGLKLI